METRIYKVENNINHKIYIGQSKNIQKGDNMEKINKLYDIIERDYGIVICDNRVNNGCFPNYRVEMKIPTTIFSIEQPIFLYGWEDDKLIYSFLFYLNQKQFDELNSEEEENETNE